MVVVRVTLRPSIKSNGYMNNKKLHDNTWSDVTALAGWGGHVGKRLTMISSH